MEQNTITNEELHGIITDLVQKVESLECCILTLVDSKSGDKLMDTKELCEYMHKSKSTIYRITNDRLVPHGKFDVFGPREAVSADPLNLN